MTLTNYKQTIFYCTLGTIKTAGTSYAEAITKALSQFFINKNK